MTDWDVATKPATAWAVKAVDENLDVENADFEDALGSEWAINQSHVYPSATIERLRHGLARSGSHVVRPVLQKAGANYRGTVWIYTTGGNQLRPGIEYQAGFYAWNTGTAGPDYEMKIIVSASGMTNQEATLDYTAFVSGWNLVAVTFTAPTNPVQLWGYCTADDANLSRLPVLMDDFFICRPGWTVKTKPSTEWSVI